MGSQVNDDSSRGQSVLADKTAGCEYADAIWRGRKRFTVFNWKSSGPPMIKAFLRGHPIHSVVGLATSLQMGPFPKTIRIHFFILFFRVYGQIRDYPMLDLTCM